MSAVAQPAARAAAKLRASVLRAQQCPKAFVQFAIRNESNGRVLSNARFHDEWQDFLTAEQYAVLIAPVEHGKAMPLDTPVATPRGFIPIGDIRDGDIVYGRDGQPARVRKAWPVLKERPVFEFTATAISA